MGAPIRKARTVVGRAIMGGDQGGPPKPPAPPPPPDTTAALFNELARQDTDRRLRQSKGRANAFLTLDSQEPYRAPGSKMSLGG